MILAQPNKLLIVNISDPLMFSLPPEVEKYFRKNLLQKWDAEIPSVKKFNRIVVIPAIAEPENVLALLSSLANNEAKYFHSTLILFVINNTLSAGLEIRQANKQTIELLRSIINKASEDDFLKHIYSSGLHIGFIDACSGGKEMDDKNGGVGLARKIGMDIALKYFNYESDVRKILVCLDADCTVAANYVTAITEYFNQERCGAAVINYEHDINGADENTAAIICYELYLRYYLSGLTFAGSLYAFHTIGSTMVCDYECYIKAGGMNKLKAAEDFYFLEKLSKITEVHTIRNTCVYPSSRPSFRVPFGTGQRVNRFLSYTQNEYLLYDPRSFVVLKKWHSLLISLDETNLQQILDESKNVNNHLYNFLVENNFELFWLTICSQKLSRQQITKQKKYWFDAFRTLKLIHYLRDKAYPLINMFDAIDNMLELSGVTERINRDKSTLPDLDKQKEYLLLLRKLQNS